VFGGGGRHGFLGGTLIRLKEGPPA
jgi:hypothetical protein